MYVLYSYVNIRHDSAEQSGRSLRRIFPTRMQTRRGGRRMNARWLIIPEEPTKQELGPSRWRWPFIATAIAAITDVKCGF